MIYTDDVDGLPGLIDAVDHAVGATTCRVTAGQFASEQVTDPVPVVQQWTGQELSDRCRDRQWQATRRPLNEDRGIRCVTLDYDAMRGVDDASQRLF